MKLKLNKKVSAGFILALILLAIGAGSSVRVLEQFELSFLDLRFQLRPKIPTTDKVVLIEIADDTIEKLGQFPLDRNYHAVLIQALYEAGAGAVVFDIFFSEAHPSDIELEKAVRLAGNVYFPNVLSVKSENRFKIPRASGFAAQTLQKFVSPAKGFGHINIIPDSDGKFRRAPLLIKYQDSFYPYLSFQVILDYLGFSPKDVHVKEGGHISLGNDFKIPLDDQSAMIVNFSGRWGKSYRHYSYVDVLKSYISQISGEKPLLNLSDFKDKICIIGLTAEGTTDLHPNPFEALYPAVGIHAEVINAVIQKNFITRAPKAANLFILACLMFVILWSSFRYRPLKALFVLIAEILLFVLLSQIVFNVFGLWVDVFYPLVVIVFVYIGATLFKYVAEWKKTLLMENELQIAKKIQESFLPKKDPKIKGLDTAAAMYTARHVGGDLYDFLEFDENNLGVMIGDVTGKGVPASLFMAMTVSAFKFFADLDNMPEETLSHLNEKLRKESTSNLFVTVYYSIFDVAKKTMRYASAGHNPLLYVSKDGQTKFLDVKEGPPAGMIKAKYAGDQIHFNAGDVFIYYTDGITEARNKKGEMFEEARLAGIAVKIKNLSAKEILDKIINEVFAFEPRSRQHDDVTCIVIKIV